MRISIWTQFSSNHSASYTVVGEFPSAETAQAASEKIQKILEEASAWCFAHYEECVNSKATTPVEQDYAKVYGFDWKERIDWLTYSIKDAITSVDCLVLIDPRHVDTWQTGHQFANLLTAMGAKVARDVMEGREPGLDAEVWMSMSIDLSAEISPENATPLQTELLQYIESHDAQRVERRKSFRIPWLICHPKLHAYNADAIKTLEAQYLADEAKTWPLHDKYGSDSKGFHQAWAEQRVMAHEQWVFIGDCRRDVEISCHSVKLPGQGIEVQVVRFREITAGLPILLEYLRAKGCVNIQCSVRQRG